MSMMGLRYVLLGLDCSPISPGAFVSLVYFETVHDTRTHGLKIRKCASHVSVCFKLFARQAICRTSVGKTAVATHLNGELCLGGLPPPPIFFCCFFLSLRKSLERSLEDGGKARAATESELAEWQSREAALLVEQVLWLKCFLRVRERTLCFHLGKLIQLPQRVFR